MRNVYTPKETAVMIVKFIKGFLIFGGIMLVIQIVTLILSLAMAMDGANQYGEQSNFMFGFVKNILGFPLYVIFDFGTLISSKNFRFELIPLFIGNTMIQFSLIRFLIYKRKK